jgi:multidrug efflux pump subunit AcrB
LNQYHVVLEVEPLFWQNPDGLKYIYARSANSSLNLVPLSAFTHYAPSTTALTVNHQGQFPAVTISFNLASGVALGDAVMAIEQATREMGLPATMRGSFQGIAQAFQDSLVSQPLLIAAACGGALHTLSQAPRCIAPGADHHGGPVSAVSR